MKGISETKIVSRVRKKNKYKKVIAILLIVAILQFVAVECILIFKGHSDIEVQTDYLIILGAGIKGETLSLALFERLVVGLEYLNKYPDTKVIVSGGQGKHEAITEAEAMRRFLVSNGIDEDRIILESHSTSTMENFLYSRQIIEQRTGMPMPNVTFITSSFHIFRSKMLAQRNGLDAHAISCKTPWQVIVQAYAREYLALYKSFFIDR